MKNASAKFLVVLSFLLAASAAPAAVLHFRTTLSAANEIPAVASTATGTADVYYSTDAHTLQVNITWSGLVGTTTMAHIHAPATTATIASAVPFNGSWGVATQPGTFTGFPTGTNSGAYAGAAYSLQADASYTTGFETANGGTAALAEAAFVGYLLSGKTYLNVHSTFAAGGEIKGYLQFVSDGATSPRLINISSRAKVGTGDDVLIAGFVVSGPGARTVLIRAVGPTLSGFGVPGALADPQLEVTQLVSGANVAVISNDNWGGGTQVAAAAVAMGAFPLADAASKDAAVLLTLQPGIYSAKASGVGGTSGNALIEVYELP